MKTLRGSNNPFVLILCFILGMSVTPSAKAEVIDRVVAKVNTSIITLSQIEERLDALQKKWKAEISDEVPPLDVLRQEALEIFILEKLLIEEGKKINLTVEEKRVDEAINEIKTMNHLTDEALQQMLAREGTTLEQYKDRIRKQILINKVKNFHMRNRVRIPEKKIKQYYDSNPKDFLTPAKIHVRHILFIIGKEARAEEKRLKWIKARRVSRQIRLGTDFIKLAKLYSEDVSASSGGDLGVLEKGKMVASFEEAAFKLRQGEISSIVETPYGLHIIKVEEKFPETLIPYQDAKNGVEYYLKAKEEEKQYKLWIEELKKGAFIETSLFENPGKKAKKFKREIGQTARLSKRKPPAKNKVIPKRSHQGKKRLNSKRPDKRQDLSNRLNGKRNGRIVRHSPKKEIKKSADFKNSDLAAVKNKLIYFKNLMEQKKISQTEYKKKKKELLNQL